MASFFIVGFIDAIQIFVFVVLSDDNNFSVVRVDIFLIGSIAVIVFGVVVIVIGFVVAAVAVVIVVVAVIIVGIIVVVEIIVVLGDLPDGTTWNYNWNRSRKFLIRCFLFFEWIDAQHFNRLDVQDVDDAFHNDFKFKKSCDSNSTNADDFLSEEEENIKSRIHIGQRKRCCVAVVEH